MDLDGNVRSPRADKMQAGLPLGDQGQHRTVGGSDVQGNILFRILKDQADEQFLSRRQDCLLPWYDILFFGDWFSKFSGVRSILFEKYQKTTSATMRAHLESDSPESGLNRSRCGNKPISAKEAFDCEEDHTEDSCF